MPLIDARQPDLLIASATDISPKQHRELMARNWFCLAKQKRTKEIYHEFGDNYVRVSADEGYGIASIFDNDVLIFIMATYAALVNEGQTNLSRSIAFNGYDFFKFTGKTQFGGRAYDDLWSSINRLHHTFVETNLTMGDAKTRHSFNWLSEIKRNTFVSSRGELDRGFEATLPDWIWSSIVNKKWILTLDDGYFNLKGGLERFLYLYARKSAGSQPGGWAESIDSLYKKSGVLSSKAHFKAAVKKLCGKTLVSYEISWCVGKHGEEGIHFQRTDEIVKLTSQKRRGAIAFREAV